MNQKFQNFLTAKNRPDLSNLHTGGKIKSAGQIFTESEAYSNFVKNGQSQSDMVFIPRESKSLVSSVDANTVLMRPFAQMSQTGTPATSLRNLLAVEGTTNNAIDYIEETGFTNNAAIVSEGQLKPESDMTFESRSALVKTIAHWIPITVQVANDLPSLQSYINSKLIYGLNVTEEAQILYGDGTGDNIQGIMTHADIQDAGIRDTNDNMIDHLKRAINMVLNAGYPASGIVLHPNDALEMELSKGTDGHYLVSSLSERLNVPVAISMGMVEGEFLVGAFNGLGAKLFEREGYHVKVSESHADFFIRNQLALRGEGRIALPIYRPDAFVKGSFATA